MNTEASSSLSSSERFFQIQTSLGSFEIELYDQHAPLTCEHFSQLALDLYYNDTIIHTIQPNHLFIAGDPTNTGRGGKPWDGYLSEVETSRLKHVGAGIIGMMENSQWYITLAPTPWLDGKYGIFGRVSKGMTVVKSLGLIPVGGGNGVDEEGTKPLEEVTIYRITPRVE